MWLCTFKSQFISVTKKKRKWSPRAWLQLCRLKKWGVTDCTTLLTLHPHLLDSSIPSSNFSPRSCCSLPFWYKLVCAIASFFSSYVDLGKKQFAVFSGGLLITVFFALIFMRDTVAFCDFFQNFFWNVLILIGDCITVRWAGFSVVCSVGKKRRHGFRSSDIAGNVKGVGCTSRSMRHYVGSIRRRSKPYGRRIPFRNLWQIEENAMPVHKMVR
jgi:hypothetical protein